MNVLAVFALADVLQWPRDKVLQAMADFKGVKRRQEWLGEVNGIDVFEDFAHHPTAVDLTIRCMRERFPDRRLVAVFEPRSATSRRKIFQKEYARAFSGADSIFIARPYDQSKIPEADRFSTDQLISELKVQGREAQSAPDAEHLVQALTSNLRPKDVVLIMSNGGFDGIYQKLFARLRG
jgi:UDP-N-acetylmuramate: L-alanyl-gamma-D-glutamyl-meso-diaminopimelate ligase